MTMFDFLSGATFWQWVGVLFLLAIVGDWTIKLIRALRSPPCRHAWRILAQHENKLVRACDLCGDTEEDDLS